jgi:hypothetical protein
MLPFKAVEAPVSEALPETEVVALARAGHAEAVRFIVQSHNRKLCSPVNTIWSRHSRRMALIKLSAYPFCLGARGSRMIANAARAKSVNKYAVIAE